MTKLKVGIALLGMEKLFDGSIRKWIESLRAADAAGIDQLGITDHVVMGENIQRYPYGKFPLPLDYPWYEPIAMLSAIAMRTERIRLSTGVLISPLRPAILLAKQLATLDVICEGRLDVGIGTGWQEEEYIASGIPFEGRYTRMMEQIRVCRKLWSEAPASVNETTVKFEKIYAYPRPTQGIDLPVWFGVAATPRNCERIAELGHGWVPIAANTGEIARGVLAIKDAFVKAGRDPAGLAVRAHFKPQFDANGAPDFEATIRQRDELAAAGVTLIEVPVMLFCSRADQLPAFYEKLAKLKEP